MTDSHNLEGRIKTWMEEREAGTHFPDRLLSATYEQTRGLRQARALRRRTIPPVRSWAFLGAAAVVLVVAGAFGWSQVVNQSGPGASPSPSGPAPSRAPDSSGAMWPQSSIEEVRQAQALADAGDAAYTWQLSVDEGQIGQNHPCSGASLDGGSGILDERRVGCWRSGGRSGEIFIRFLQEELRWESFLWTEAFAHRGFDAGDVVFVRCAAGRTNSLYPADPEHPGCAPTIDELRYETVKISVAQPDRQGPTGIWVVAGWELIEPATQTDPRVVDAEATGMLRSFLQARIDGDGAEELADFPQDLPLSDELASLQVPLLYATSTGARYERSEFERVEGPLWPHGFGRYVVRLFAESGRTIVEQHFYLDRDDAGRLRLVYRFDVNEFDRLPGGGPGTTENGNAVPVEYTFLDGAVTYKAAYPLRPSIDTFRDADRLAIDGLLPDDGAPRRIVFVMADPRPTSLACDSTQPADVETLVQSLVEDPDFEGSAPRTVTIGGRPAVMMDGVVAVATPCGVVLRPSGGARPDLLRLYLVDLPGGAAQVMGLAISADADSFETVLQWAMPIVESIGFHTP